MEEIRVDYVFRNRTEEHVRSIVPSRCPTFPPTPILWVSVPWFGEDGPQGDNIFRFLGGDRRGCGRARAGNAGVAATLDVTEDLIAADIRSTILRTASRRLAALDDDIFKADWGGRARHPASRVLRGWRYAHRNYWPLVSLRATYWWCRDFCGQ